MKEMRSVNCKLSSTQYYRLKRALSYRNMSIYQYLKLCCVCVDKIHFVGHQAAKQKFRIYAENVRLPNNWMRLSDARAVKELREAVNEADAAKGI